VFRIGLGLIGFGPAAGNLGVFGLAASGIGRAVVSVAIVAGKVSVMEEVEELPTFDRLPL
jgi:hypothetical protein